MDLTFRQKREKSYYLPPVFSLYGPFEDGEDPMFPVKFKNKYKIIL